MNLRVKGSSDGHPSAARSSRHSRQVFVALAHWHCPTLFSIETLLRLPKSAFIDSPSVTPSSIMEWYFMGYHDTMEALQEYRTATSSASVPWDSTPENSWIINKWCCKFTEDADSNGEPHRAGGSPPSTDQGELARVSQRVRTTPNEGQKLERKINGPRNLWFTADTGTLDHTHPRTESGGLGERSSPPTYMEKKERTLPFRLMKLMGDWCNGITHLCFPSIDLAVSTTY
ncbi:hypothetical protein EDD16DRAFT_1516254 [Pisolithus croceorrhizus]|nr:hypothetical protein EDD16DRAFT_1516254 [Pisolithus croceorrhizus]